MKHNWLQTKMHPRLLIIGILQIHINQSMVMNGSNTFKLRQRLLILHLYVTSLDLYDNLPNDAGRFYKGKPIGNSPEFMPLDTHLNQDLHTSHDLHVTITQALPDNDHRKFDGSTPNRLSDSYRRLFHPDTGVAPTPNRIMQDVTRVLRSLEMVLNADGNT